MSYWHPGIFMLFKGAMLGSSATIFV
jgi:hypothetical protein